MTEAVNTPRNRLLIVDYDEGAGNTLKTIFAIQGYDVVFTRTAEVGLKVAEEWEPDLVIADMILYGLTGLEFAKRITLQYPECRVILLAAMVGTQLVNDARAQGFDFYGKPLNPAILINRASQLLSVNTGP
jgi:DNA-binding response OmpR family regulator